MKPRLNRYAIVHINTEQAFIRGVVLDYDYRRRGEELVLVWNVYLEDGREREFAERDLEQVGQLEAPIRFYAIVEINPRNPRDRHMRGRRGVVEGNAWNPKTGEWSFAVTIQNGEGWSFMHDELRDTGLCLPPEVIEQRWGEPAVHIAVSVDGSKAIVLGDENAQFKPEDFMRYVPFPVDLDRL